MTTWYTSDLHFGHANILGFCNRPYRDTTEMNEMLIHNWNERVAYDDLVFVLGDVAMGSIKDTLPLVKRLMGHKILVVGNHDRCFPGSKRHLEWVQTYTEVGFIAIAEEIEALLEDVPVRMCHFPYSGDSGGEDRFSNRRPTDDGRWLLHGHVHDVWKVKDRQINVGTDVWDYTPVSQDEILAIIREVDQP